MGTDIRPRILFVRTAIPATAVILAVIASGLVLKSLPWWTSAEMDALRRVNMAHTPQLDWFALGINWLFAPPVAAMLVLVGTGTILLATRRPGASIRFLLIVAIPTLGAAVIKVLVHRPRPDIPSLSNILVLEPGGLSFPSGHTSFAVCFVVGFVVVAAGRRRPLLIGAAAVVVLATAASRVYLGVHYPSDVVASIVYSIAAVAVVDAAWLLVMAHWTERRSGRYTGAAPGGASDAR
jgi:undecaprenyl-diphosphatase